MVPVLELGTADDRKTEVAYYAGLKAESEGRLADANNWYQVVLELGKTREGEYRWAHTRLYSWRSKEKYLSKQ